MVRLVCHAGRSCGSHRRLALWSVCGPVLRGWRCSERLNAPPHGYHRCSCSRSPHLQMGKLGGKEVKPFAHCHYNEQMEELSLSQVFVTSGPSTVIA